MPSLSDIFTCVNYSKVPMKPSTPQAIAVASAYTTLAYAIGRVNYRSGYLRGLTEGKTEVTLQLEQREQERLYVPSSQSHSSL